MEPSLLSTVSDVEEYRIDSLQPRASIQSRMIHKKKVRLEEGKQYTDDVAVVTWKVFLPIQ